MTTLIAAGLVASWILLAVSLGASYKTYRQGYRLGLERARGCCLPREGEAMDHRLRDGLDLVFGRISPLLEEDSRE